MKKFIRVFFISPFTAVCSGLGVLMYWRVHSARLALQPIGKEQKQKHSILLWLPWLIIGASALAVMGTYLLLSHTYDEPAHVAAGLEWWMKGEYKLEPMHPPFARLMTAIFPLIAFGKTTLTQVIADNNHLFAVGWAIFKSPLIDYWKLVFLSRLGILPFYIASCVALFFWTRRACGLQVACWALALYATLPAVSGNAGLATTDMPAAAMLFIALYGSLTWLNRPTPKIAAFTAIAIGLMICCKFSTLLQFPAAFLPMVAFWFYRTRFRAVTRQHWLTGFAIILPLMLFVVLAVHLFSVETIQKGIEAVLAKNSRGHAYWLFGPLNNQGVWYYFPVLFLFKTPLPFVLLTLAAFAKIRKLPDAILYPIIAALGVLVACAFSDINIGLRHVLIIYPLFAIAGGYVMQALWQRGKKFLCWFLLAWQCASFICAYPNLFAYFNALALDTPQSISSGPDIDWGQDIWNLEKAIQKFEMEHVIFCNFFTRESLAISLLSTPMDGCSSDENTTKGWFVVSRARLTSDESFTWLEGRTPVEDIGSSYILYYLK